MTAIRTVHAGEALTGLLGRPWVPAPRWFGREIIPPRFVYFAERDGLIKIGLARNVSDRCRTLKMTPLLALEADWWQAHHLERALHASFADARVEGEWFSPTAELVDYMLTASGGDL